jgi:hypothetical protein
MVFRGWYDFGGGSMADMGHYSLWTVFNALDLQGPLSIDPMLTHETVMRDSVTARVKNDFSFPAASIVRFQYPARGQRGPVDLVWYEGGMRPPVPEELAAEDKPLPAEGMMFVGDKGKILSGFHVDGPRVLGKAGANYRPPAPPERRRETNQLSAGLRQWVACCRGGAQSPGSFLNAGPISEAVNLYAIALRTGRRLVWDAKALKITNAADTNRYLSREYRRGWELA